MNEPRLTGKERNEWEQALLRTPGMKSSESHVLMALLRYGGGSPSCWPSNESLRLDTHLSEQTIRTSLNGLERRLSILGRIQDLTLKTQRRIVFLTHPKASEILAGGGMKSIPPRRSGGGMKSIPPGVSNSAPRGGMKSIPQNIIGEKQREPSVSQSGDDRLTDDSLSLSREEWGPDQVRKVLDVVSIPKVFKELATDPEAGAWIGGRWEHLCRALIRLSNVKPQSRYPNPEGYLLSVMNEVQWGVSQDGGRKVKGFKPSERATLRKALDGTTAAERAAAAKRRAELEAEIEAEERAEKEVERSRQAAEAEEATAKERADALPDPAPLIARRLDEMAANGERNLRLIGPGLAGECIASLLGDVELSARESEHYKERMWRIMQDERWRLATKPLAANS